MATRDATTGRYPPIEPYATEMLEVGDGHTIYVEQSGNPDGKPVVGLHGGPGGGSAPAMREYFDPEVYRIVLFDQRGCGKSTPFASLEANTTWHLVADIERIREHLGIDTWQVWGGSWGSTLALSYSQKHPERVTELVLRGIFMLRRSELLWFYQDGGSHMFPDAWDVYRDAIPEVERHDFMSAYYRRLTSSDPEVRAAAAKAWSVWEASTSFLQQNPKHIEKAAGDRFADAFARIECHYFVHGGFFECDDQLLRDVPRIQHIPCTIVHGRYDVVCPIRSAWDLKRVWPEAKLVISPNSGHSAFEHENSRALVDATDAYRP